MPTPRIPSGFKPLANPYTISAPDGVSVSEVAGGMPRPAMHWSRGKQQIPMGMVQTEAEFSVWTIWFQRTIRNGAIQFLMPLNTGMGMQDHLCMMLPGSYSAVPAAASKLWSVSFTVVTESSAYTAMTDAEVETLLAVYEATLEDGIDVVLARIAKFASEDTLVLA